MLKQYFADAPNIVGFYFTYVNGEYYILYYYDESGQRVSLENYAGYFYPHQQVPFVVEYVYYQASGLYCPVIFYLSNGVLNPFLGLSTSYMAYNEQCLVYAQTASADAVRMGLVRQDNLLDYTATMSRFPDLSRTLWAATQPSQDVQGGQTGQQGQPDKTVQPAKKTKKPAKAQKDKQEPRDSQVMQPSEVPEQPKQNETEQPEAVNGAPVYQIDLKDVDDDYSRLLPNDMIERVKYEKLQEEIERSQSLLADATTASSKYKEQAEEFKTKLSEAEKEATELRAGADELRTVNAQLTATIKEYESQGAGKKPFFTEDEYDDLTREVTLLTKRVSELVSEKQVLEGMFNKVVFSGLDMDEEGEGDESSEGGCMSDDSKIMELEEEVAKLKSINKDLHDAALNSDIEIDDLKQQLLAEKERNASVGVSDRAGININAAELLGGFVNNSNLSPQMVRAVQTLVDAGGVYTSEDDIKGLISSFVLTLDECLHGFKRVEQLKGADIQELKEIINKLNSELLQFRDEYVELDKELTQAKFKTDFLGEENRSLQDKYARTLSEVMTLNENNRQLLENTSVLEQSLREVHKGYQDEIVKLSKEHSTELAAILHEFARGGRVQGVDTSSSEATNEPNTPTVKDNELASNPDDDLLDIEGTQEIDIDTDIDTDKGSHKAFEAEDAEFDGACVEDDTLKDNGGAAEDEPSSIEATNEDNADAQNPELINIERAVTESAAERLRRELAEVTGRVNKRLREHVSSLAIISNPDDADNLKPTYEQIQSAVDCLEHQEHGVDLLGSVSQILDRSNAVKEMVSKGLPDEKEILSSIGVIGQEANPNTEAEESTDEVQSGGVDVDDSGTESSDGPDMSLFDGMGVEALDFSDDGTGLENLDKLFGEYIGKMEESSGQVAVGAGLGAGLVAGAVQPKPLSLNILDAALDEFV